MTLHAQLPVDQNVAGRVRIYACGGAGTNIGKHFYNGDNKLPGYAITEVCFLDTSRSNLDASIRSEDIFLIEGLDGSGKIRSENYQAISNVVAQIRAKFKPADLNLVVFSASGG